MIDNEGKVLGEKRVALQATFKSFLKRIDVVHPTIMFRAVFFEKYGYYDSLYKKAQDMELWLRATYKGAVVHNIDETLYLYRFNRNFVLRRKKGQRYRIKIKKKYLHGIPLFISLISNYLVIITPSFLLSVILKIKFKKESKKN